MLEHSLNWTDLPPFAKKIAKILSDEDLEIDEFIADYARDNGFKLSEIDEKTEKRLIKAVIRRLHEYLSDSFEMARFVEQTRETT